MPKLFMKSGRDAGKSYALSGPCILGRGDDVQIRVYDAKASREHCRVFEQGGQWVVVDLNSRNGITVNGVQKTRHTLRLGDEIAIGETVAVFQARSSEKGGSAKPAAASAPARSGPPEMTEAQKKAKAERDKAFAAARKDAGGGSDAGGGARRRKGSPQTGADGGVTISKNPLQYNKEKDSALGFDLGQMPFWQQLVVAVLALGVLAGLGYGLYAVLGQG